MGGILAPSSPPAALSASDLFNIVASKYQNDNFVYSPASIQCCLTLALMAAGGETAQELSKTLMIETEEKEKIAEIYKEFVEKNFENSLPDGHILKMANRIYVNQDLELNLEFRDKFHAEVESLNFADSIQAIEKVNAWVAQQMENKIQTILYPGAIDGNASSILVNAIYFKAKWERPFEVALTRKTAFHISITQSVQVQMMQQNDCFNYVELSSHKAKALELRFKNSELSMLIILPNKMNGLAKLERKLKVKDINDIMSRLRQEAVRLSLPKFRIEYDIDLKHPLMELGLNSMFSYAADFSHLFKSAANQMISDVRHKAFLDVNEAGCEAGASTYMKNVTCCLSLDEKTFNVNHPFMFVICNKTDIFFAGHVVRF